MLMELFDIMELLVMMILPFFLCCLVLKFIFSFVRQEKQSVIKHFKDLFCLSLTMCVITSILIITAINIYQVAVIFENEDINKYVLETIFLCVEFIWQMIGVVILFIIWKYIPNTKLISGDGNLKTRIKNKFKELKKNIKKEKNK